MRADNVVSLRRPMQKTMNPSTLLRLADAFPAWNSKVHILRIGAEAGTWPGTVYRAEQLGYLVRVGPAVFRPTPYMRDEVKRARRNQKMRAN